jgi:methylmalonyl-CoA mutase cobalamin-binding subunit
LKTIVAGALGECVHVAGIVNFLRLADQVGWRTVFLGPAVSPEALLEAAKKEKADLVGVSYRLTPETGERLLGEFAEAADELRQAGVRFAFGGTPPVAERAKAIGFFEVTFDGSETTDEIIAYLRGQKPGAGKGEDYPQTAIQRIRWKHPYPILRHHYGQPTMKATVEGIQKIAEAKALDVISLGIDQDAQANFFHPERQNPRQKGAGGVPVRSPEDYRALYTASRRGNFPLLRSYSGTDDFIKLAEMYTDTINIAWCAIPIFWFNKMDGRGPWDLETSIRKHQEVMAWYGEHEIPVELNEPHHWGMRDAPDVIFVVSAYLSAYNAKFYGVKDYIAQMMFNSPPGTSDKMDLAKMLACLAITEPLGDDGFRIWRQTRTGLLSYPLQDDAARAHLAASIYLQMAVHPHILHIVGHTEAHHAATAEDIIQASRMARQVIDTAIKGQPEMALDPLVQRRVEELISEARITLEVIKSLATASVADPLVDPATLTRAVTSGILDAPHLKNNAYAQGKIQTRIVGGACWAVNSAGEPISETQRHEELFKEER